MISAAQFKAELEHIRLIHFSVILVTAALLSFSWSAQSDSELPTQLTSFEQALNLLNSGDLHGSLKILSPETVQYAEDQARISFQSSIQPRLRWHVPFNESDTYPRLAVFVAAPSPIDLTASLESIKAQLEGTSSTPPSSGSDPWRALVFNHVRPIGNTLSTWIQETTEAINKEQAISQGPQVDSVEFEKSDSSTTGRMRLHTVIFQTKRSSTESTTFVRPHRASFDFEFSADEIPTPLSPAWLWSRHPLIAENWEQLKMRNLSESKQWAKQQARKSLKERRVEILGLKFDGPQIAISGPTVLVFMLVYLSAYLIYLYEKTTTFGLTKDLVVLSPWTATPRAAGTPSSELGDTGAMLTAESS